MSFPFEIKPLEKSVNECLMKDFTGERTGFVQVGEKKWLFPAKYAEQAAGYYNLPLRKDDVWIVAYPRSGSTWIQELVWLVNNNVDFEAAASTPILKRIPFMEISVLLNKGFKNEIINKNAGNDEVVKMFKTMDMPGYQKVSAMESPRHIKTHIPLSLLPPDLLDTCKVVYVARNPKDVAVSYYHHNRLLNLHGYRNDFPTYWDYFQKDLLTYSPYWDHIFEGWEENSHPNMLFLLYEEVTKDMPGTIQKVAKFLNKPVTSEQSKKLESYLHIDNFKSLHPTKEFNAKGFIQEGEEGFIRKGGIGGSRDYFTPEMNEKAEKWINNNLLKTDLRFPN